ncbi:MAG: type VI secretion system baseplate subunit TssG [Pseudomonadota bacterium]
MRTLATHLAQHYGRFNLFQLVRLLRWDGKATLRFKADLRAGFPAREISRLAIDAHGGKPRVALRTTNFCLGGTLGALPEPFTEWLREQEQARNFAMGDFLDMFNHRTNMLRVELKSSQLPELGAAAPVESEHARRLGALMGADWPAAKAALPLPPRAWLALAAVLANCRRSAADIARVLGLALGCQARLEQWIGAWTTLEAIDRSTLGRRNGRLGMGTVLGTRVWDQQARIRLTLPGLDYARACALLPPEPQARATPAAHANLCALLRLMLDRQCDTEVRLGIAAMPPATLTARPDRSHYWGLRLGQTAWLGRTSAASARFLVPADPALEAT